MMKILFNPQDSNNKIYYKFDDSKITVTINDVTEVFDFTYVPDGILELTDPETGGDLLQTALPINPIISAEKREGILYLELINWIGKDARYSERFPEWMDAGEYNKVGNIKEEQDVSPVQNSDKQKENNLSEGGEYF